MTTIDQRRRRRNAIKRRDRRLRHARVLREKAAEYQRKVAEWKRLNPGKEMTLSDLFKLSYKPRVSTLLRHPGEATIVDRVKTHAPNRPWPVSRPHHRKNR